MADALLWAKRLFLFRLSSATVFVNKNDGKEKDE